MELTGVLSFWHLTLRLEGSDDILHRTARVPIAARRCGGRLAAGGARAAAGAGARAPKYPISGSVALLARVPSRPQRSRLRRTAKRIDRISLGRLSLAHAA